MDVREATLRLLDADRREVSNRREARYCVSDRPGHVKSIEVWSGPNDLGGFAATIVVTPHNEDDYIPMQRIMDAKIWFNNGALTVEGLRKVKAVSGTGVERVHWLLT